MSHAEQRAAVIEECQEWIGTPHVEQGRIKGVGADCAEVLVGAGANVGLIEPFKTPHRSPRWHLHANPDREDGENDLYVRELAKYLYEIPGPPEPGDIAVFHVKHAYAHAGIVVEWPHKIIHCLHRGGVQWGDAARDAFLIMEQRKYPPIFFSFWKPE